MESLILQYLDLKEKENELKILKLELEQEIIKEVKNEKKEGSKTVDFNKFKITTTNNITRKLDYESYLNLDLPFNFNCVKLIPKIDIKKLRITEALYPMVLNCITETPGKTSVKITLNED